jgi:HK97 family phage portal protein
MGILSAFFKQGLPNFGLKFRWGISTSQNQISSEDNSTSIIYTCCKILSENISRMPILIKREQKTGVNGFREHHLWDILNIAPNNYQSPQVFWGTIEYHRNYYGNALVRVYRYNNGKIKSLDIIHPSLIKDAKILNGNLTYYIQYSNTLAPVRSDDILHFRSMTEDGVFGMSPVYALSKDISILTQAEETIDNFYKNKATSQFALTSELGDSRNYKVLKQAQEDFLADSGGAENAGKVITLPPNTKLNSLASNYADAQLIETMKSKKQDIAGAFSIPLYMLGDTKGDDAENSSLVFRNYTISPIVAMYRSELEFKLLSKKEKRSGITIEYDLDTLIEADIVSRTRAIAEQVKSGLMTPNEGASKLGNSKTAGEWGDYHYVQAQYVPLEKFDEYEVFDKGNEPKTEGGSDNTDKQTTKPKKKKPDEV